MHIKTAPHHCILTITAKSMVCHIGKKCDVTQQSQTLAATDLPGVHHRGHQRKNIGAFCAWLLHLAQCFSDLPMLHVSDVPWC